ncbi:hypothetical protein QX201_000138 [Fusarium graminearum]|uniref:Uncharacterized protein n=1 Tax=Gibberella zeae TaxID=5518 RepID=A0A2H3GQQ4_GIBZA|nr:hypothetical protein FGRA07_10338 [Fusarium graminearum]CAF3570767.1 unnamed protein product [Fusarium graminearum]CAG1964008.1 unnamed protein product [Fusarium graminearum]
MCVYRVETDRLTGEKRNKKRGDCKRIICKYSKINKIWRSMNGSPGAMQTARGNAAGGSRITIWRGAAGETPPMANVNGRWVVVPSTSSNANAEGSDSTKESCGNTQSHSKPTKDSSEGRRKTTHILQIRNTQRF